MMRKIIVDSSIWIGAFVSKDRWHDNGKKVFEWLEREKDVEVIVPIGVIYEVISGILNKSYGGFKKADKALKLFMTHERFRIFYNTEESFTEVQEIFRRYERFSLVDATIVLLYENQKCSMLFTTAEEYNSCTFITHYKFPV